jgi:hypothetical protein
MAKRPSDDLGNQCSQTDRWGTQREERVHRSTNNDEHHADGPGTNGVCGYIFIVIVDCSADFGIWRVLDFLQGEDIIIVKG